MNCIAGLMITHKCDVAVQHCTSEMAQIRNRCRTAAAEGGLSHDLVPLCTDDLFDVHARHLIKIGYQKFMSPPKRITQKLNEHWKVATSWGPLDNPEFALDLDGALYDEAVDTMVMQNTNPLKNEKSKTSVCLIDFSLI